MKRPANEMQTMSAGELRMRAHQLSLREQLERNHFMLKRLNVADQRFSIAWSVGVEEDVLQQLSRGAGMVGRAAHQGVSQFRDRQPENLLMPFERKVTVCLPLKANLEVVGVIVILGLLPQKNGLEWTDFELLKFLETYGAVAVELQDLQKNLVEP